MKKPDLFIIGAPKCGTTSLAGWLAEHPSVYMSPVKEPHHFNDDEPGGIIERGTYERLFEEADDSHLAVAEASVRYLYSRTAVPNILKYSPEARFIVMVRNPVEMAPALHEQRVFSLMEDVREFELAWALQEERSKGNRLPKGCPAPDLMQYGAYCCLGEQLERLFNVIPENRCKVVVLDDLRKAPRQVYLEILDFLGLPDDGRLSFPRQNIAKERRSRVLALVTGMIVRPLGRLKRTLKLPATVGHGIVGRFNRWNRIERPREGMSEEMEQQLIDYFSEDIHLMERLLGRDLGQWIESGSAAKSRAATATENPVDLG